MGGWLDQPYILLTCFRLIEDEKVKWGTDKKLIERRNKELIEKANAQNPKK